MEFKPSSPFVLSVFYKDGKGGMHEMYALVVGWYEVRGERCDPAVILRPTLGKKANFVMKAPLPLDTAMEQRAKADGQVMVTYGIAAWHLED